MEYQILSLHHQKKKVTFTKLNEVISHPNKNGDRKYKIAKSKVNLSLCVCADNYTSTIPQNLKNIYIYSDFNHNYKRRSPANCQSLHKNNSDTNNIICNTTLSNILITNHCRCYVKIFIQSEIGD